MAFSPEQNAANSEILRYDLGWDAINSMLRAGRSLSGHERNCCFLNSQNGRFADISGVAGLDFDDDGRVLALSDWDYDGDMDFWIANRSGPQIRFLQNELQADHRFVKIRLEGVRSNRDAIGARVVLNYELDGQLQSQTQSLRAGEGYLAQNSKWLHFGLGKADRVRELIVTWPTGEKQVVSDLPVDRWFRLREGDQPKEWSAPKLARQASSQFASPTVSDRARIVLLNPMPLPLMQHGAASGTQSPLTGTSEHARFVNLWATWCQPCLAELSEWKQIGSQLAEMGVDIVAVNADEESADRTAKVNQFWDALKPPFELGFANQELVSQFDTLQRSLLSRQRPLPLPSTFLIDREGRLRIVYKGPVEAETLLEDAKLVQASSDQILTAAIPFDGKWVVRPSGSTPLHLTVKLIDNDLTEVAREYVESLLAKRDRHPEYVTAGITNLYAAMLLDAGEFESARQTFELSLELDPTDRAARIELGNLLLRAKRGAQAEPHFEYVLRATPHDPELTYLLGVSRLQQGKLELARESFTKSIAIRPSPSAYWQLGTVAVGLRSASLAIDSYERAIEASPGLAKQANNLAWLLATIDDPTLRNGPRALELAEQIARTQRNNPSALDTLAAACAATGDFPRAEQLADQAMTLAIKAGKPQLAERVKRRLEGYRLKRSYRSAL